MADIDSFTSLFLTIPDICYDNLLSHPLHAVVFFPHCVALGSYWTLEPFQTYFHPRITVKLFISVGALKDHISLLMSIKEGHFSSRVVMNRC